MAEILRHPSSMTIAGAFLGYVHIMRGDLQAAVGVLERGLATSHEHDLVHGLKANGLYLAWAYLLRGERERGLDHLRRALERSTGSFDLLWTRHWTVPAYAYLAAGRLERAARARTPGRARGARRVRPDGRVPEHGAGRRAHARRTVGLGQVHAAPVPEPARGTDGRHGALRRP